MLRVLLIDHPLTGRYALPTQFATHRDVAIVAKARDLERGRALLAADNYDVVFLGTDLGAGEGLTLLPHLRKGARVVCITAPDEVTTRSLEAAGVECLSRPVRGAVLASVLERLRAPSTPPPDPLVPIRDGAITRLLPIGEIRLVAACDNYTEVLVGGRRRILVRRTMQQWAAMLPPAQFARAHRGLFVNLDRIGRVERGPLQTTKLHFVDGSADPLEVKRRHWPALRTKLEAWRVLGRNASAAAPGPKSIAVLPFANLSAEPANEHFCDGVSEELLNVLSKIPMLRVAARTSSFYFKGTTAPIGDIARQLGVDYLVEGSVRRIGSRVRITAQLIRGADGFHAWSENFDRELTDILGVQDDIAGEIAANLQLQLASTERAPAAVDVRAHWLTLEGRHFWNLRTSDGFTRAEAAFKKALALDPRFAPAHSGLADVHSVRALYRLADGAEDVAAELAMARSGARRALQLDPTLAEPHATLGFIAFQEGRLAEAGRDFPKAFALNPNYATGYQFYAWVLAAQGWLDRALATYEKSIERDPLSFINIDRYAAMLALAGKFPEALAMNERAATLRSDVFVGNLSQRAPILFALDRRAEAIATAREVRQLARNLPFRRNSDADAIFVLQQAGLVEEAAEYALESLQALSRPNYLRGFILAALGRHESALPSLERVPSIMLPQLYFSPMWDAVREKPAFQNLINKLGRRGEYQRARESRTRLLGPPVTTGTGE